MKEFRITWAYVPTSMNPTRVNFVVADNPNDARQVLVNHIERTEGRKMSIHSVEEAQVPPAGVVK